MSLLCLLSHLQDLVDPEVALRCCCFANQEGLVSESDCKRVSIGGRVDDDRSNFEVAASADDPHRDLSPVCDQDALEQGLWFS